MESLPSKNPDTFVQRPRDVSGSFNSEEIADLASLGDAGRLLTFELYAPNQCPTVKFNLRGTAAQFLEFDGPGKEAI